ncbi:CBS domain-containing protein [Persicimonas caeni]|uniref:CBS domain-containing protein n=1 Tax=Persicimonas caeni TaxID=2292766 RepID=A0A4Y6PQA1_PERCE|nr:CBS domain-containing protein [Persicimonas caeni]QDG50393.1 CBS domain-containing protein [Persicimonas caeni]QED31614.1 CBS domain-containing protein [Persicimonas caeni]
MGQQNVNDRASEEERRRFMRRLLRDVRALEQMLEDGMFETGIRRIGAEQEMFLVDEHYRPATRSLEILEELDDEQFTTELGLFNIEFNAKPNEFGGDCLSKLERQLTDAVDKARRAAGKFGADIALTGILPTMKKSDLGMANMTPMPRYKALNNSMTALRGKAYDFHIKGIDEFIVQHDNVMLEACNTSFQVHFQVAPDEFARLYNIAQAVAGPVLAVATNSPMLFGKRLWKETRIALFQQSVDTRSPGTHMREMQPRVSFGHKWIEDSVLEIYRDDISRFRLLFSGGEAEDPFEAIEAGRAPKLSALRLHTGTVYRWNRACYGISDGKPHLRIENRVLPSGPTPADEVANAAFWFGLMSGLVAKYGDITEHLEFVEAKNNFFSAARHGLAGSMTWVDGEREHTPNLVLDKLLPLAETGLRRSGVDEDDIARYLGIIERRVRVEQTGADWMLDSFNSMEETNSIAERLTALTKTLVENQRQGILGHEWQYACTPEEASWEDHYQYVGQYMSTDLFTVNEDEIIDMVAAVMEWKHVRHVPVEDNDHRLVGLVTRRAFLRLLAKGVPSEDSSIPVRDIMTTDLITVTPETTTIEAIQLMREHTISSLPVVDDGKLVGMVTERDFMAIARDLLEERLAARAQNGDGRGEGRGNGHDQELTEELSELSDGGVDEVEHNERPVQPPGE